MERSSSREIFDFWKDWKNLNDFALHYRKNPTKDPELRKKFFTRLRRYLAELKNKYLANANNT